MKVDAFALRLRTRSGWEAADLGVRLCQREAASVYRCYALVAIPYCALCLATWEFATWLPGVAIWWGKPWLDRTVLFVLARAGFGQSTSIGDLWNAQRDVWWRQFLHSFTLRRLSLRRSFTQAVYQLEGAGGRARRARLKILRQKAAGTSVAITSGFSLLESLLTFGLLACVFIFAPRGQAPSFVELANDFSGFFGFASAASYAAVVLFLEPFYVAAGFALYLNRRVELEAWDIEQEFRRAFAR